jgi:hypothetical protein
VRGEPRDRASGRREDARYVVVGRVDVNRRENDDIYACIFSLVLRTKKKITPLDI